MLNDCKRTCHTCHDYRPGAPEAPGYEGCSWAKTPIKAGVEMPVVVWVGAVRCVRADQADLDRGCPEWRERCDPFARKFKTSAERRAKAAVSAAKHRNELPPSPLVPCPQGCGRYVRKWTTKGKLTTACPCCKRSNEARRALVAEVRAAYDRGEGGYKVLAARFEISRNAVQLIVAKGRVTR